MMSCLNATEASQSAPQQQQQQRRGGRSGTPAEVPNPDESKAPCAGLGEVVGGATTATTAVCSGNQQQPTTTTEQEQEDEEEEDSEEEGESCSTVIGGAVSAAVRNVICVTPFTECTTVDFSQQSQQLQLQCSSSPFRFRTLEEVYHRDAPAAVVAATTTSSTAAKKEKAKGNNFFSSSALKKNKNQQKKSTTSSAAAGAKEVSATASATTAAAAADSGTLGASHLTATRRCVVGGVSSINFPLMMTTTTKTQRTAASATQEKKKKANTPIDLPRQELDDVLPAAANLARVFSVRSNFNRHIASRYKHHQTQCSTYYRDSQPRFLSDGGKKNNPTQRSSRKRGRSGDDEGAPHEHARSSSSDDGGDEGHNNASAGNNTTSELKSTIPKKKKGKEKMQKRRGDSGGAHSCSGAFIPLDAIFYVPPPPPPPPPPPQSQPAVPPSPPPLALGSPSPRLLVALLVAGGGGGGGGGAAGARTEETENSTKIRLNSSERADGGGREAAAVLLLGDQRANTQPANETQEDEDEDEDREASVRPIAEAEPPTATSHLGVPPGRTSELLVPDVAATLWQWCCGSGSGSGSDSGGGMFGGPLFDGFGVAESQTYHQRQRDERHGHHQDAPNTFNVDYSSSNNVASATVGDAAFLSFPLLHAGTVFASSLQWRRHALDVDHALLCADEPCIPLLHVLRRQPAEPPTHERDARPGVVVTHNVESGADEGGDWMDNDDVEAETSETLEGGVGGELDGHHNHHHHHQCHLKLVDAAHQSRRRKDHEGYGCSVRDDACASEEEEEELATTAVSPASLPAHRPSPPLLLPGFAQRLSWFLASSCDDDGSATQSHHDDRRTSAAAAAKDVVAAAAGGTRRASPLAFNNKECEKMNSIAEDVDDDDDDDGFDLEACIYAAMVAGETMPATMGSQVGDVGLPPRLYQWS